MIDQLRLARACAALCLPLGHGLLWAEGGPTQKALDLRAARRLDKRSRTLVHAAWSVWNGGGDVGLSEVLGLELDDVRAFASLVIAIAEQPKDRGSLLDEWTTGQLVRAREELDRRRQVTGQASQGDGGVGHGDAGHGLAGPGEAGRAPARRGK